MCGINGIAFVERPLDLESRLSAMNESIRHRGADFDDKILRKGIALGHRRLSIIDLNPSGNQPMTSESGKWSLVFNGEIYNHREIREYLPDYCFKGHSDTEVILAAVEIYGVDWFLEKANGMFAIGLYNHFKHQVYLVRDRLGIKPLHYWSEDGLLVFSSEIKGILASGLVQAKFNESAIDDYLAYRYVREPNTFFENISQVESGSYLVFNGPRLDTRRKYWEVPSQWNDSVNYNEAEVTEKFEEELLKAIKMRMISDVPLGCYLSGGVDSSLLTAVVQKFSQTSIHTFNIGFSELNEFEYARLVANQSKTNHHEIRINDNCYFDEWEKLISFKDAPLAVPNEIPLSIMSRELKRNITVVLSGEGADELLGGYGKIYRSYFDYQNHKIVGSFYDYFIGKYEYVSREMRDKYLLNSKGYRDYFDPKIQAMFESNEGEQSIFQFFHRFHVKGLLQRVDMSTMQTTVEARVPFLDHKLVEFCYKEVPSQMKLKWVDENSADQARMIFADEYSEKLDIPKYLLKKVAFKYIDPRIINRKKVGFPVPLNKWLVRLEEMLEENLSEAPWLNHQRLADLIDESRHNVRSGQILWMFINIEKFRKLYFNKNWKW
ncbi:asparagine synthase (glutamine-hydrolyzing) [bacterium]|nr:asparagine synthase (glutamine-hydrolyzing) [bacterium]